MGITIAPGRAAEFINPQSQILSNNKYPRYLTDEMLPPKHFGYTNQPYLGQSSEDETDLLLLERDKVRYSELLPQLGAIEWNISDFNRLQYDKNRQSTLLQW